MSYSNYGTTGRPPPPPYSVEGTQTSSSAQRHAVPSTSRHPSAEFPGPVERQALLSATRATPNNYNEEPNVPASFRHSDKERRGIKSTLFTVVLCLLPLATFSIFMFIAYYNDPNQVIEREREKLAKERRAMDEERKEHEIHKVRWELEYEQWDAKRREWEREEKNHERELQRRAQREEDERMRLNLGWAGVEAHQCTTYATREYTAVLTNVPVYYDRRLDACRLTPLTINGVSYLPSRCEDNGPHAVIGHWTVNQHEPDCTTYWREYRDKGCTSQGSGKRRIEHYLEMLPVGASWETFCATTPIRFHGMEFQGAQHCNQQHLGTYGYWDIDDANC